MARFAYLLILCLALAVAGCGTQNMALTKDQPKINLTNKSIALLSVKLSNENRPGRQLDLHSIGVLPQSATSGSARYLYKAGSPYRSEKDQFNEYLLSIALDSGAYDVRILNTQYDIPFLVSVTAPVYLFLKTDIKPSSVTYLGHLDVVLRERKNDNEEKASIWPVLDSAIVGLSTGTFDVVVQDRYDEDVATFTSQYPALKDVRVEKSILPEWVRLDGKDKRIGH